MKNPNQMIDQQTLQNPIHNVQALITNTFPSASKFSQNYPTAPSPSFPPPRVPLLLECPFSWRQPRTTLSLIREKKRRNAPFTGECRRKGILSRLYSRCVRRQHRGWFINSLEESHGDCTGRLASDADYSWRQRTSILEPPLMSDG